ncbi:MAG: S-layer homology domain-containing protein [Oscillospiraceae bacterium]|jgi:hypothetical protein|nr:S-layer homology domain-containing protein [Oscillospiraceae bacterium]
MKLKRFGALALSLALTLSLAVVPARALTFSDVDTDFWGYEDITKMSNRGLAKGYDDGTFKPNGRMTAAETLLFCARATGVDTATQAKIAQDRGEEIAEVLPTSNNMNVWATAEMALAVETGVLSVAELEELSQVDPKTRNSTTGERTYLEQTMSREKICMYLVRAMQLEPLARGLGSYSLSYTDRDDIAPALQPYVFVLTNYGIVKGKDGGLFDPKGAVTRAEMTTMLSRALDFMDKAGIVTELSEYTTYDWRGGVITTVTSAADGTIILGLSNEISGAQSYSIPAAAKIYDDNMLTSSTALRAGQYVRLNLGGNGTVEEVRLSGVLTAHTGSISDLTEGQLSLLINGAAHLLTIDRFTEVAVAKSVGGRELIDEEAGYTTATCYVDEMGHLAGVKFSGGTMTTDGLVESVTTIGGNTTLGVTAFNGVVYHYPIPAGTTVMINGALGSLSSAQVGKYVQLRVGADDNRIHSIAVDTVSRFVQGPIKRLGTVGTARSVFINDVFSGKETSYTVSQSAAITYDGEVRTLSQLESGWYVTVMISNNMIVQLDGFPGSAVVEGTLSSINYGPSTVIQVSQEDDSVVSYTLDITDLPTISRNGKSSSIDQLRTGDRVSITIRYNEVERIDAVPQDANLTGVIDRVTQERSGVVLDVTLADGSKVSYTVSDGVSVSQNGSASNIYNLKPGFSVALVTNGDQVVSIDITAVASSSTELSGAVLLTSSSSGNKTITLQVTDSMGKTSLVVMDVRNANLMDLSGRELSLTSGFAAGDMVRAFGAYDGATFVATIVIKQ